jgi:hypothetical protein
MNGKQKYYSYIFKVIHIVIIFNVFKAWLPYDTSLWTSASDDGCEGKYGWCSTGNCFPSSMLWTAGNPDNSYNNEHCVGMYSLGFSLFLNDLVCTNLRLYLCEVSMQHYIIDFIILGSQSLSNLTSP